MAPICWYFIHAVSGVKCLFKTRKLRVLPRVREAVQTFSKSGGGLLPLQRLDKAHTAFLVIVRRVDLVSSLGKRSIIKKTINPHLQQKVFVFFSRRC